MESTFVIGIDGGGTKTAILLADGSGKILSSITTSGSNHQIVGIDQAVEIVSLGIRNVCEQVSIDIKQVCNIHIGIAGADLKTDFTKLQSKFCQKIEGVPFKISNDIWNVFSSETTNDWGAVSICGTGNNLAVKDKFGKIYSVRALQYILGNYGGGNHLAQIALHYAFRYSERTGVYTKLTESLPVFCSCKNMSELAERIYLSDYKFHRQFNISSLVYQLAESGDEICVKIIRDMGAELGNMMGHLICTAKMASEPVPVILSGGLFANDDGFLLINSYEQELKKHVPNAVIKLAQSHPAVGALITAMHSAGLAATEEIIGRVRHEALIVLGKVNE